VSGAPRDPRPAIPHRPPILCIDAVLESGAGRAVAEGEAREGARMAGGEMWEGTLIEGMAQTAALLLNRGLEEAGKRPGKGVLAGIRGLRIARRPRPGERVRYAVEVIRLLFPLSLVSCEARSGDEVLAAGEMKFFTEAEP
jgi:3-hydroxyacyl-[acyl-carrier-protein] dehydratase